MTKRLTTEQFIEKAKKVQGDQIHILKLKLFVLNMVFLNRYQIII